MGTCRQMPPTAAVKSFVWDFLSLFFHRKKRSKKCCTKIWEGNAYSENDGVWIPYVLQNSIMEMKKNQCIIKVLLGNTI